MGHNYQTIVVAGENIRVVECRNSYLIERRAYNQASASVKLCLAIFGNEMPDGRTCLPKGNKK